MPASIFLIFALNRTDFREKQVRYPAHPLNRADYRVNWYPPGMLTGTIIGTCVGTPGMLTGTIIGTPRDHPAVI